MHDWLLDGSNDPEAERAPTRRKNRGLQSVIEHRGTLGRTEFSVVRTDGVRKLTIGDWSTTLTPETKRCHRNRWLYMVR
ncbi:hypothetical protein [Streptomyces sp. NPDC058872]|uniref:hypothetical protein n=1 Tax=Streptomyces sp. NPDC058872 TaxID=3346661 RepID=UPI0036A3DCF7